MLPDPEWLLEMRVRDAVRRERVDEVTGVPGRTVTVNAERTRYVVTTVHVDEATGETCPACGMTLWTRDGKGEYVRIALFDGAPLLQGHYRGTCGVTW